MKNRTRDLSACSSVPQPTTPPRTSEELYEFLTSVVEGSKWWSTRRGGFTSGEKSPRYPLNRRLYGPQSPFEDFE